MREINAVVTQIKSIQNLSIVKFDFEGIPLSMMSLELNDDVQVGTKVILSIKPTHVAIAKNFVGDISYSNQISAKIQSCENGELLSSIELLAQGTVIESIITRDSSLRMNLQVGDDVTIMVKASELFIKEVVHV